MAEPRELAAMQDAGAQENSMKFPPRIGRQR
jgi:hypothetical protein